MRGLSLIMVLLVAPAARADFFDRLNNNDLSKTIKTADVKSMTEISSAQLATSGGQIPGITGALLILQTREGRLCKLTVQAGQQKIGQTRHSMVLIDRFVTFKEGDERTIVAKGGPIQLFATVRFNADLGQVVPPSVGGDLELGDAALKVIKPAKLWLATKVPSIGSEPRSKFVMGDTFEPRFFNGSYKLHDDGRRSGTLNLDVDEAAGTATGSFYSDKDGRKYDVTGKLGTVRHQIQFAIRFPQTEQQYQGFMFTGDGRAIAGVSKLKDRESGFYAVRIEGDAR